MELCFSCFTVKVLKDFCVMTVARERSSSTKDNETWMHGDWFYTTGYGIFGHEVKTTKRSPPGNRTQWIITQSEGFTRKAIEEISRSVRAYVCLVLTSQVQARSSIVGNSAPAVDAQQVFKSTFKALINEDYSIAIDIERCQGVLEHVLSKVHFSTQA